MREEILDAAFGDPEMWKIRNIINGSGTYLEGQRVMNYFELHDEAWPTSGGGRIVKTIDPSAPHDDEWAQGRTKLAQGLTILSPGVPAFLMGSDWLEDTDFGTDAENRIDWAKKVNYSEYFAFFQDLISVKNNPAFRSGGSWYVHHVNESGNVIGYRKWDAGNDFVVIGNFSNNDYTDYRVGLPQEGVWREVLNSMNVIYGGPGPVNSGTLNSEAVPYNGYDQSITIDIPKMALIVLEKGDVQTGTEDPEIPGAARLEQNYPNPFNPSTTIAFAAAVDGPVSLKVYDVSGRLVRVLLEGEIRAGRHEAHWNGKNDRGTPSASGVYFYQLVTGRVELTRRMILLR
jgi:hypothetical protein